MDDYVGIVCGQCDAFNPLRAPQCLECDSPLASPEPEYDVHESPPEPPYETEWPDAEEESMDQQRNYVCEECSCPVPVGSRFCGVCGAPVPPMVHTGQVDFFGSMQVPGRARLILIRGDQGVEGLTFLLQGDEHVAGRVDAPVLFPDDVWMSPRHANFVYVDGNLVVKDEGSANGIYVRVRGTAPLALGDHFLCGEQLFRIDEAPADTSGPSPDQTYFYSSPRRPSSYCVTQVLIGGSTGMRHCARESNVLIGREEADMNFPLDVFMSGNHARVEMTGANQFQLHDMNSRNGSFVRIRGERTLAHGDYLFLGKQLLRVEITV